MEVQTLQEMQIWNPPKPKPIVADGILYHQTKMILFAGPKMYKSLLAQQLAFCAAAGAPWIGYNTAQSNVLYIQAEIPKLLFRTRVVKMAQNQSVPVGSLAFASEFNLKLDRAEGRQELEQAVKKHKPNILILDPLYKILSGPEETNVVRVLDTLDWMIGKADLTVILIHHSRKPRTNVTGQVVDMGGSELRGPLFEQWADSILRIRGDIETDDRTIDFELRNAETLMPPINITLNRSKLWFTRI
jgi:RecA-family ATPase